MRKTITLDRIIVKKLFNRFTYDIDLDNGNDIAIIIAPNGCGKTTIFNMIDFVLSPSVPKLIKIMLVPFESFECVLSNGKRVVLERKQEVIKSRQKKKKSMATEAIASLLFNPLGIVPAVYTLKALKDIKENEYSLIFRIDDDSKGSINISERLSEVIGNDGTITRYFREQMNEMSESFEEEEMEYSKCLRILSIICSEIAKSLNDHECRIRVNFISADRLRPDYSIGRNNTYRAYYGEKEIRAVDPLNKMQKDIKMLYRQTDSEYNKKIFEARDKLPRMYLDSSDEITKPFDQFKAEWKQYTDNLDKLNDLGLLDSSKKILNMNQLETAYKEKGVFLLEYLKAFETTLDPWNDIYPKLKLFADIINKRNRITRKKIRYGQDGIIVTVNGSDKPLPLECLSSGEKNDLIMFYNLIFKGSDGDLVLIDEPEISLHIEWQEEYLDYLIQICKLNGIRAIVATHSPNIVNGHFELYSRKEMNDEFERNR